MRAEEPIAFHRLYQDEAASLADELSETYGCAFREAPYHYGEDYITHFRTQLERLAQREGAALVVACHHEQVIGFAFGLTLPSAQSWWFNLATELEPSVTEEYAGRTFVFLELAVRPSWRRKGIATQLHDLLLARRPEQRATLTVRPNAYAAQSVYNRWGWYKVAQKYNPQPDNPLVDILLKDLPKVH